MHFHFKAAFAAAFFALWGAGSAWAQDTVDNVQPLRGAPVRGTVVEISPNDVTVDSGGVRKIPVNELRRVTFADDPADLRMARDAIASGQIEDALELLKKVDPANIQREVVRQDYYFQLAFATAKLALERGGDAAAAWRAMSAYVQNQGGRTSYHFYRAAEVMGDLSVAQGNFPQAASAYAQVARAPWPDYKMRAQVLEGRALLAQGDTAGALKRYDEVLASGLNTPEAQFQKTLATIGKAVCLAKTGQAAQGVGMLEKIIADADASDSANNPMFAKAYTALGNCYLATDRPKDALIAFLHVDVLFDADGESHSEALYHLGNLWGDMNKNDRSANARGRLKQRYPGSVWANK